MTVVSKVSTSIDVNGVSFALTSTMRLVRRETHELFPQAAHSPGV